MKKLFTYIMVLSVGSMTFMSCSSSKKSSKGILGGTNVAGPIVKTVATVVGLILLSKLIKNVLGTISGSKAFAGLTDDPKFVENFKEETKLNSFLKSDFSKAALQVLLVEKYKIPVNTVTSNFNNLNTVGDLATFIGQNADAKVLETIK